MFYGNLWEKRPGHLWGHRFARACAIEMHMDMSQEAFCTVIYKENAGPVSRDHRHVTRRIVCGNLHGECRTLPIPPHGELKCNESWASRDWFETVWNGFGLPNK